MSQVKNNYVYGSTAEKIKYDPYEENEVLKSKKIARNNSKLKAKIVLNIFIIFAMCAIIMFRYAQISQMNYDTNMLKKQYAALQSENELLSIQIQNAMDLNNIREVVENKLGMHKPDKSQIVYVSIPKKDVTILANKEQPKLVSLLKDIENGLKKFLNVMS